MTNTQRQVLEALSQSSATMYHLKRKFGFSCDDAAQLFDSGLVRRINGPSGVYCLTEAGANCLKVKEVA